MNSDHVKKNGGKKPFLLAVGAAGFLLLCLACLPLICGGSKASRLW